MEALLIDDWMHGLARIPIQDSASVSLARTKAREEGARAGLSDEAIGALAIVISELAQNQLAHAARGRVAVRTIDCAGVSGVEIVAADEGRGIADPARAFEGASPSAASLGIGLAAVRSLSDELDVDIRLGEGTCIRARKFGAAFTRRREVAIFGRPCIGERVSGDQAGFERSGEALLLFVVDGLGHGREARETSDRAVLSVRQGFGRGSVELLRATDAALLRSRGAVMAVAQLDQGTGAIDFASVGNILTHVVRFRKARLFTGSSFVLGMATPSAKRISAERVPIDRDEVLVMCSDGISSRATLEARPDLLRAPPITIAQHVLETFGQDRDDATVLVAR